MIRKRLSELYFKNYIESWDRINKEIEDRAMEHIRRAIAELSVSNIKQ